MTIETMKIRITLIEEMLGTASGNPELHREYIASKAPDAEKREEEVARLGADEVAEKQMTGMRTGSRSSGITRSGAFSRTRAAVSALFPAANRRP